MTEPRPSPVRRAGRLVRRRWRRWLRALHRDVGYLAVGLTFVYALSGIAVDHIGDWDPNYHAYVRTEQIALPLPADPEAAAEQVVHQLGVSGEIRDAYLAADDRLEIELDRRALHVDLETGRVTDEGQKDRFFFRAANWLHENRGKAGWKYIADGYAALLLYLAVSGVFMIKGRKGVIGRGAILIAAGVAVPLIYLYLTGGPGG